jgi:peptidoglycan/LPS O-acetylase OafA/YrhL
MVVRASIPYDPFMTAAPPSCHNPAETSPPADRVRYEWVDAWRGIAAVLIVWHHLTLYAPQSDLADLVAPNAMYFFYNHALYAVQVFLVISGFSLSMSETKRALSAGAAMQRFVRKFWRLAYPQWVSLWILLSVGWIANALQIELGLVDQFTWPHFLAHMVFMQDLLGFGNFAAGGWYLCIIVQYLALVFLLQVLSYGIADQMKKEDGLPILLGSILLPLGLLSAWYWNRDESYDATVLYFLTPLVLGTVLGWVVENRISGWVLFGCLLVYGASLIDHPRPQLWVALMSTTALWLGTILFPRWKNPPLLKWLSRISYSLFLVHYMVNGVVLVALDPWARTSQWPAFLSMLIAFLCSLGVAELFYRWVEAPAQRGMPFFAPRTA